jgi:hypothetical protein
MAYNIDQYIGDPGYAHSSSYSELVSSSEAILGIILTGSNDLQDFTRIMKFYDNVVFKSVEDFSPARSNFSSGIIVKPHILERNKTVQVSAKSAEYENLSGSLTVTDTGSYSAVKQQFVGDITITGSIASGSRTGSDGGSFGSSTEYSTAYSESIMTPDGLATYTYHNQEEPKYDGEFSGSNIALSSGELNVVNTYKYDTSGNSLYQYLLIEESFLCGFAVSASNETATPAPTAAPVTPSPTPSPTPPPTPSPVTPPPTPAPVASPVTPSPVTPSPVTPSPTEAPVTSPPVTPSPTEAPVTSPPVTPSPTEAPVTSPPTNPPTEAPVTSPPVTPSPTEAPVTTPPTTPPTAPPVTSPPTNPPVTPPPTTSCTEYEFAFGSGGGSYEYVDCDGVTQTGTVSGEQDVIVCVLGGTTPNVTGASVSNTGTVCTENPPTPPPVTPSPTPPPAVSYQYLDITRCDGGTDNYTIVRAPSGTFPTNDSVYMPDGHCYIVIDPSASTTTQEGTNWYTNCTSCIAANGTPSPTPAPTTPSPTPSPVNLLTPAPRTPAPGGEE